MKNHTGLDLEMKDADESDISTLREYFDRYPSMCDDFTVGGILMWKEYFKYQIAIVEDTLIIKGVWPENGTPLFYEPRGPMSMEHYMNIIADYCHHHGCDALLMLPVETNPLKDSLPEEIGGEKLYVDWTEYLYDIESFITFSGKKMEKKRNHLNFFRHNFADYEEVVIGSEIAEELIDFVSRFSDRHSDNRLAVYESRKVIDILRDYDRYPFLGVAIRYEGRILGFSFGEKGGDSFVIHAEKGDIDYRGVYQAVASAMAKVAKEHYPELRYLNREDDMGIETLRKSKLSYHPTLHISKKIVSIGDERALRIKKYVIER
ncbi:MAG: DUF2156 domain-containing protein [Lepagella sp.]